MAIINVSNTSQLLSALSSAKGGDTIVLASGNYGAVDFKNLSYSSMVTVKSANPDKPAVFSSVDIDNVSHLRIDDVEVADGGNGAFSSTVVSITNSDHVEFLNSDVHGLEDNNYNGHYGIYARDNTDIKISGNYVHDVKNGFVIYPNQGIEVSENYVDYIGNDGFKFIGISDFLIENNAQGGHVYPEAGAHLDFIQFQGSSSSDGVIRGNVFLAENTAGVQGIFLDDVNFYNIVIEQNIIATGMLNGIVIGEGSSSGITIRDNTLINIPDTVHKATKVLFKSSGSLDSSGNLISSYEEVKGSNYQIDTDDYGQIFQGDIRLGLTLEDLRPVEGSVAETYGAADRLAELLDGTSYVPKSSEPAPVDPEPAPSPAPSVPDSVDEDNIDQPDGSTGGSSGGVIETLDGTVFSMLGTQDFSGKADVVEIAHNSDLALESGTIALSFNADTVAGRYGLLSKDASYYSGGGNHLAVYIEKGTLILRFQDGSGDEIVRVPGIKANQDYDLQLTFGDNEIAVWLNGNQVHSADFSMTLASNVEHLQVGALGWGSTSGDAGYKHVFDGSISDVVIVEGKWTPEQMQEFVGGSQPVPALPVTELEPPAPEPEQPAPEPEQPAPEPDKPADNTANTVFEAATTEFNGSKSNIRNLDHDQALELQEGTIAFTFNADDLNGRQGLLSKDASYYDGGDHLSVMLKGDDLVLRFQDAETQSDANLKLDGIKANQDYDVQIWFTGDEIGMAVNGELLKTQAFDFDLSDNQQNLQIGGLGWSSSDGGGKVTNAFDGTISDLTILDEALAIDGYDLFA